MFNFKQLQEEQIPWVKHNFGKRPSWMPLSGIVEEYGEYLEAQQTSDKDGQIDALADIVIFLSDYCTARSWDLQAFWDARSDISDLVEDVIYLGRMHHCHLKMEQKIRASQEEHDERLQKTIILFLANLEERARLLDKNLVKIVEEVWNVVKLRDWKKERAKKNRQEARKKKAA